MHCHPLFLLLDSLHCFTTFNISSCTQISFHSLPATPRISPPLLFSPLPCQYISIHSFLLTASLSPLSLSLFPFAPLPYLSVIWFSSHIPLFLSLSPIHLLPLITLPSPRPSFPSSFLHETTTSPSFGVVVRPTRLRVIRGVWRRSKGGGERNGREEEAKGREEGRGRVVELICEAYRERVKMNG